MELKRLKQYTAKNQSGFALPTVIIMTVVMSLVAYAALLQANNNLNLAFKQAYIQMARTASKSAVDYAQEEFDNSTCGEYNGTAEQEVVSTDHYRITMKADVLETSADGYEKVIKGTGSVYLPKTSENAKYVFDIRSEIVRTYALCKSPDNFGPLVWLDASDTDTLKKTSSPTTTTSATTGGAILDLFFPNDTIEEKVSDGTQGILSWLSNDIEMHTCDTLEYTVFACYGSLANRDLYTGIVFQDISVPKNAEISSASLQFRGATPSGTGGSVTHRIYGLYENSSNPHLDLFEPFGTNQVKSRITNADLHTASYNDHTENNFPPGNTVNYDVTSVVQEMVNNANWSPSSNDGRIGFGISRLSGTGNRKACKGNPGLGACEDKGPFLTITYSDTTAVAQAENGEGVNEWQDKSGNGNHARSTYGNVPTRQDNQINGETVVRFNDGAMLSSLTSVVTDKREMTVLAVVKPDMASSANDARFITGMSESSSSDTSGTDSIIPLLRNGSTDGFSSVYASLSAGNRTDYNCAAACEDTPFIISSIFSSDGDTETTAKLKGNGVTGAEKNNISPSTASPPYTYSIDQIYYGGRRDGALPGSGASYFDGDFAEIAIYDKALTCREIEALEEYFRTKWNIAPNPVETECPADLIPTL